MFVTIKAGEKEMKKHFTISSSPSEQGYIEFTKRLTGSEFSNTLSALKLGDWAKISASYGDFTFEGEFAKVALLLGGIGITPLRSMCRFCTDMKLDTKITLLYGNRSEQDIVFRKEFEEMRERNRNLKVIFTLDEPSESWKGHKGRINADMIKKEIPDYRETVFFTCGPPAMVERMKNLLAALNMPQEQIKWELFSGY
jgi:ferredoxin-NADP reductase